MQKKVSNQINYSAVSTYVKTDAKKLLASTRAAVCRFDRAMTELDRGSTCLKSSLTPLQGRFGTNRPTPANREVHLFHRIRASARGLFACVWFIALLHAALELTA